MPAATTELLASDLVVETRARCSTCESDAVVSSHFRSGTPIEDVDEIVRADRTTALRIAEACIHRTGQLGGLDG